MSRFNHGDLVDYYSEVYAGKIKAVEKKWLEDQRTKYQGCPQYMANYAKCSKTIFNSYSPAKGVDSKRTYVLWKLNSICECLRTYGYGCNFKSCAKCPVHNNCNKQLEEIDAGIDQPTGGPKKAKPDNDPERAVFFWKGHRVEVAVYDD